MTDRANFVSTIRNSARRIDQNIEKARTKCDRPDYSDLSDVELQLLISLTRKAYGCVEHIDLPLLELSEGQLISASHNGYYSVLKSFDIERLSAPERSKYLALSRRVAWTEPSL